MDPMIACYNCLAAVAARQARMHHVPLQDTEDCVMDFVLNMWRPNGCKLGENHGKKVDAALLEKCAINHVLNYIDRCNRRNKKIICNGIECDSERISSECPQLLSICLAEQNLLRMEFWLRMERALKVLSSRQKKLFYQYFILRTPIKSISISTGKSEGGIKQCLYRIRKRLRREFIIQGCTEEEMEEYLSLLTPPILCNYRRIINKCFR